MLDRIVTLQRRLTTVCTICNGPSASHLHYGAVACYSCRAFFRRGIGKPYCCVEGTGDCGIDWTNRRSCQWCRFDRSGETLDVDSKTLIFLILDRYVLYPIFVLQMPESWDEARVG